MSYLSLLGEIWPFVKLGLFYLLIVWSARRMNKHLGGMES